MVTPFQDLVISKITKSLQDILSEKLPDYSQYKFLLSVNKVNTTDVSEGDLEQFGDLKSVVGVLDLNNTALSGLSNLLPVDTSGE